MIAYHVRARRSPVAADSIEPSGFFGSLQWMPPGKSTIRASANGQPKTLDVTATPATAQLVDARIKEMIVKAQGGKAALPFIDFDHADKEAAAWAQSASWGGTDPLTGGVRLHLEWSDVGRAKVKGKSYQGFSPEFLVNSDGVVTGVGLNLGGLVNRPAFSGIQRVLAAHRSSDEYQGEIVTDPSSALYVKAASIQGERGVRSLQEAVLIAARENPGLYTEYHAGLGAGKTESSRAQAASPQSETSSFLLQARQIASERNIPEVDAALILAHEMPELYHEYAAGLGAKIPLAIAAKRETSPSEELQFVIQAKELALHKGLSNADAMILLAKANPQLYQEYMNDLGRK